MSVKDRLLRRIWFLKHFSLMNRELEFHRDHQGETTVETHVLWHLDEATGTVKVD